MHSRFRDNVHVEAVAKVDGVNVVAFQVRVHDGEEDLEEEVDCIEQDGKEKKPEFVVLVMVCGEGSMELEHTMLLNSCWRCNAVITPWRLMRRCWWWIVFCWAGCDCVEHATVWFPVGQDRGMSEAFAGLPAQLCVCASRRRTS